MNPSASAAVRDLSWFLTATQQGVTRRFQSLTGSMTLKGPEGHGPIVFVPGQSKHRVLLVAHYDTVWDKSYTENPVSVRFLNGLFFSANTKMGIGADDRAGCTMLWLLRSLGHSLLLVPGEEKGCVGSHFFAENHPSLLKGHTMALEFDRRGNDDIATYDCHNDDHVTYLRKFFGGYTKTRGSSTDVRILGPAGQFAIANLSVGFTAEHTSYEKLRLGDFLHCYWGAQDLLSQSNIPSFPYKEATHSNPAFPAYHNANVKRPHQTASSSPTTSGPRVPVSPRTAGNETAVALRSVITLPGQPSGTVATRRPFTAYLLGDSDERLPVTAETGEAYCEGCRSFVAPGLAGWDASNLLTCPCCGDPLRSFFS